MNPFPSLSKTRRPSMKSSIEPCSFFWLRERKMGKNSSNVTRFVPGNVSKRRQRDGARGKGIKNWKSDSQNKYLLFNLTLRINLLHSLLYFSLSWIETESSHYVSNLIWVNFPVTSLVKQCKGITVFCIKQQWMIWGPISSTKQLACTDMGGGN